jgi:hypothetical protein
MGKHATGAEALYKTPSADSFRTSWDAAIIIGRRRNGLDSRPPFTGEVPGINRRSKLMASSAIAMPQPGQVMNEHGEWEDEGSMRARAEEAKDSICEKLLRARRLFLAEISGSAGKRAAFEILTELPIDWDKAKRLEPQPDEPWHRANQRQPDMILTAENGWSAGEIGYGEDKKKALREAINQHLIEEGKEPVDWSEEDRPAASSPAETRDPPSRHSRETGNPASSPYDRSGPRVRRV